MGKKNFKEIEFFYANYFLQQKFSYHPLTCFALKKITMHFTLSEEHLMIQKAVRDFAINEYFRGVIDRDKHQRFPKE